MSESSQPIISFQDVGVYYRKSLKIFNKEKYWALRHLSFDVYRGETLGIVGKNGAGKSTLMKLMAGIINPNEGIITRPPSFVQLLSLQVGVLAHLSGRENAIMTGLLLGMRKKDVMGVMDKIVAFSELGAQIDDPVRTYSAGMRARLGFAVANQINPDILLIDEALSVGDAKFRQKSKAVMAERIQSDKTVVMVSHNEDTIKEYCSRVIWLDAGVTQQIGDPGTVVESYMKS